MLERNAARRAEIILEPRRIAASVARIARLCVLDIFILAVAQREEVRRILAHRAAQGKLTAGVLTHERLLVVSVCIVIIVLVCAVVDAQRPCRLLLVEPRTAIHERVAARIRIVAAHLIGDADRIAHAAEIRVADAYHSDHAV